MTDNSVLIDVSESVATITLNRPAQLNALNEPTRSALLAALEKASADRDVRSVVLTGAGRAFCVGQDLAAVDELEDCEDCVRRTYNPIAMQLATMPKPVVAAVNGPAVGAGMGFALGCDVVLMAESSFLSCAFGKVGLAPDSGTTFFLARSVGAVRAFEIATSGRRVSPQEAVALGLANRVLDADTLASEARSIALTLAKESPKALAITKRLLRDAQHASFYDALAAEALAQGVLGGTREHVALRTAFLDKSRK